MSRTSEYSPEYVKKAFEYLEECEDVEDEFHKTRGDKTDSYEQTIKVNLPTVEGLADYLGFSRKTLYNWADQFEAFAFVLEKIKNEQLKRLVNKGLAGTYNPVIAKLMLSHNHGMREKSDVTTDDQPLNIFTDEQADKMAERIAARKGSDDNASGT